MAVKKAKKQKSGGGFWRGVIVFLFGVACGTGGIAGVAVYVNGLHLPFVKEQSKAHSPSLGGDGAQSRREAVEFQDILRQQQPLPAVQEELTDPAAAPRRFDYYLQIGAFKNREVAEELRGRMILDGHSALINTGTLADGSALYRVWTGTLRQRGPGGGGAGEPGAERLRRCAVVADGAVGGAATASERRRETPGAQSAPLTYYPPHRGRVPSGALRREAGGGGE